MAIRLTKSGIQSFDPEKTKKDIFPITTPPIEQPEKLPSGFIQDPNAPGQMIKLGTPNLTMNKPRETLRQQAEARARGELVPQLVTPAITQEQAQTQENLVAGLGTLTPEQMNRDIPSDGIAGELFTGGKAAGAGIGGALTGAATGAKLGAAAGTVGGPLGTLIGGIAGTAIGVGGALYVSALTKKRDNVKEAYSLFSGSKGNMKFIINQVNSGKMSNIQAAELWDEELANFYIAEEHLKDLTDSDLDRFLSKGLAQYEELEAFKRRLPYMQGLLGEAIRNPDPTKVLQEEMLQQ